MHCIFTKLQVLKGHDVIIHSEIFKDLLILNWFNFKATSFKKWFAHRWPHSNLNAENFPFFSFYLFSFNVLASLTIWMNHLLNGQYKRNKVSITNQIDWCMRCDRNSNTLLREKERIKGSKTSFIVCLILHSTFECGRISIWLAYCYGRSELWMKLNWKSCLSVPRCGIFFLFQFLIKEVIL